MHPLDYIEDLNISKDPLVFIKLTEFSCAQFS